MEKNKLTEEMIDTGSDEELLSLVFDHLYSKASVNFKKEYKTVQSWNKSKLAIYVIWLLEGEVNNGGFNQFYVNSSGQFYKQLPEALELVGAFKFSDLCRRANETYEKDYAQITKFQDGTIEGFSKSYQNNPLNKFDDEFYDLYKIENLLELQVKYIKAHKSDFIDQ